MRNIPNPVKLAIFLGVLGLAVWGGNQFMWHSSSKYLDLLFRSINVMILLLIIYGFGGKGITSALKGMLKSEAEPYYEAEKKLADTNSKIVELDEEYEYLDRSFEEVEKDKIAQVELEATKTREELLGALKNWEEVQMNKARHAMDQSVADAERKLWQKILTELKTDYRANPKGVDKTIVNNMFTKLS